MCVETAEGARGAESSLKMKTRDAGIQAQCTGTALGKEATMHERYDQLLKKKCELTPCLDAHFGSCGRMRKGERVLRVPELHGTQEAPARVISGAVDHGCHTCCTV